MADKLWHLRILADDAGVMNRSASETGGEILVVSQFTLYGDTARWPRPSWVAAARPEQAEPLVEAVVGELRASGRHRGNRSLRRRHAAGPGQRRAGDPDH